MLPTPYTLPPGPALPEPPIEASSTTYEEDEDYTQAPAEKILPEKLRDPAALKKFGSVLEMMCQASDRQIENMKPIWKQLDDGQKNKSPQGLKPPYPGAPEYHFPVLEPNLDKGRAFIAQPLTKANPYTLVHAGGAAGKRTGRIETALHLFYSRANYPRWLRMAIDVAQRRGKSTIRALFEASEEHPNGRETPPGIRFDVFSPEHRVRYPNWAVRWQDVLCDGTRWTCTMEEITHLQEQKYYLTPPEKIVEGQEEEALPEAFDQDREDDYVEPEHAGCTMRDVWVPGWMVGEHRKCWYRVWFHLNSCAVLRVEKWTERRPPLFDFFLHEEYNRWLNERSRARSINGSQMFANDMRRLFVWATLYQVSPPAFANGSLQLPHTAQQYKPGSLTNIQGLGQVFSLQTRMDMSPFPQMIQLAKEDAELAGHLSLSAHGVTTPGVTATAVQKAGLGQDVGVDEDVAYANVGLSEMAEYICQDLLYSNFLRWYPWYMDSLPTGISKRDFDGIYSFQVNGEMVTDTPEAMLANIAQVSTALAQIVPFDPNVLIRYPDLMPGLVRAAVDAANRGNMDSLLPTPEEEETQRAQEEAQVGSQLGIQGIVGSALSPSGMAMPPVSLQ